MNASATKPAGNSGAEKGNAIIELAIVVPVLLVLSMGAADFARVFYHIITLTGAADTGASYGALSAVYSGRNSQMTQIAKDDASSISHTATVTATADRYCDCPANPATGPGDASAVDCIVGTCPGYGPPRVYVRTRVQQQFSTFGRYPGIPQPLNLGPWAYRRVQ